jgi:L-rhamnose isomerase/sugar isomerase
VTDPLESLMMSVGEVIRAYVQAHLVDRQELAEAQQRCDAIAALACLKRAFQTDVSPLVGMARLREGGAIDPIAAYRVSGYRAQKTKERPARTSATAGIV